MTSGAATVAVILAALAAQPAAAARERMMVMVLVEDDGTDADRRLSDNLTEVAIAELAEGHDRELVGARELRPKLEHSAESGGLVGCSARPACLALLGELTGASRAVIGSVRRRADSFALTLDLVHIGGAARGGQSTRTVPLDLAALIVAVREGVGALIQERELPPARLSLTPRAPSDSGHPPPPSALLLAPSNSTPPSEGARSGPSLAAIAGYSAAGLAVVAFSGSAVLGVMAEQPPSGETRAQKQMDLSRRMEDAERANALLLGGTLLTALAATALIWHWRH